MKAFNSNGDLIMNIYKEIECALKDAAFTGEVSKEHSEKDMFKINLLNFNNFRTFFLFIFRHCLNHY